MTPPTPRDDRIIFIALIGIAVAMGLLLAVVAIFAGGVAE